METNPYQPPKLAASRPETDDWEAESQALQADFELTARLRRQAFSFDVWRNWKMRRVLFPISIVALLVLLSGIMMELPSIVVWISSAVFVAAHALQILLPVWWTRQRLRKRFDDNDDPCPKGQYRVHVQARRLRVQVDQQRLLECPLGALQGVFFLGDMLVIVQPPRLIPIPQTARFNVGGFTDFCQLLAKEYQAASP